MYAPSIGLFVAVVWIVAELGERLPVQRALRGLVAAVVLALAALSWRQQANWADHVTLFTHAVAVTPDNGFAHHILSQGLAAQGRYPEALVHAREAVRLEPNISRVHKNLGYVLFRLGLVDEAIEAFRSAIAIEPEYAEAHGNLGFAYARKGWSEAAMKELAIERELMGQAKRVVKR
jgi:Flp pilus assembly protein TadD